MKKIITRVIKSLRSVLPEGQKGAVDAGVLCTLFMTYMIFSNNGFKISDHPSLEAQLKKDCGNFSQLLSDNASPADVLKCGKTLALADAVGMADTSPDLLIGLMILGAVDSSTTELNWSRYVIGITTIPVSPEPNTPLRVDIHITSNGDFDLDINVSVSITGSNGYPPNTFSKYSDKGGYLSFDIPGADAGTQITITATVMPGTTYVETKTFTKTVTTVSYPTYSGSFQVQGVEKYITSWHNTAYTCSCTLTRKGTATVTIEPFTTSANKPYIGYVKFNTTSTLSDCSTTTSPDAEKANMCYPHYSGETWNDTSTVSIPGVWTTPPLSVKWIYSTYGGPCSPINTFSGTVTDTFIDGSVSMTPDPTDPFCSMAIQSGNSQFFSWPLNK